MILPACPLPFDDYICNHQPRTAKSAALSAHVSCPPALIKPPICTKDVSQILSWPLALNLKVLSYISYYFDLFLFSYKFVISI